jgi:hypothetical protein
MNLAAQDIHEPGVFEEQLRRLFAPRDAELLLDVPHVLFVVENQRNAAFQICKPNTVKLKPSGAS